MTNSVLTKDYLQIDDSSMGHNIGENVITNNLYKFQA